MLAHSKHWSKLFNCIHVRFEFGVFGVWISVVCVFFSLSFNQLDIPKKVRHGSFVPSSHIIRCLWLIHFISLHIHNDIVIIYNARFCTPFSTGQFEIILLSFFPAFFFNVLGVARALTHTVFHGTALDFGWDVGIHLAGWLFEREFIIFMAWLVFSDFSIIWVGVCVFFFSFALSLALIYDLPLVYGFRLFFVFPAYDL